MKTILGIDLGIRTGLALFSMDARLIWFRSHNFGTRQRLRKGIYTLLCQILNEWDLLFLIMEGSKDIGKLWMKRGQKIDVPVYFVSPEVWREAMLFTKNLKSKEAKKQAIKFARKVIVSSGLAPPRTINHNAAEAILIGLWGVKEYTKRSDII